MGKELVRQLVASGRYVVHSLDIFLPSKDKCQPGVYMHIRADVTNKKHLERALNGIDVVFHVAGLLPTNVKNTPAAMCRVCC